MEMLSGVWKTTLAELWSYAEMYVTSEDERFVKKKE